MQGRTAERLDPANARVEMGLGRCLAEGDPEETSGARRRSCKTFAASLAIESLLFALLVLTPLLSGVGQPQLKRVLPPQLAFFGNWREHIQSQQLAPAIPGHTLQIRDVFFNPSAPKPTNHFLSSNEIEDVVVPDGPGGEGVPGGVETAGIGFTPPIQPPHAEQPVEESTRPLKLSAGVVEAQLVSRIEPAYPALAVQTKREGTVLLHAIISKDGRISSLDVLSGDPLLVKAALDAVRQWRYRPTLLNGEPVEVETSITVIFRLRS
jgi:periplasmic protein TonB